MGVHDAAARGFDSAADEYERARPGYPAAAIDLVIDACGIDAGTRMLDLAAGTGKLTRSLVATGASVVAAEPVEGMARRLHTLLPEVALARTLAEHMPFADGAFRAVTVAQAFHWFDESATLRELARVLVEAPGNRLIGRVHPQ